MFVSSAAETSPRTFSGLEQRGWLSWRSGEQEAEVGASPANVVWQGWVTAGGSGGESSPGLWGFQWLPSPWWTVPFQPR